MRQSVQSRIAVSHQLGDGENAVPDRFTARQALDCSGLGSCRSWIRVPTSPDGQLNSGAQPASWCHVGVHNLQRLVRCSPSARRCWRNRHATRVWQWASTPWVKCWQVMQASLPRNDNNSPSSTKVHSSMPFVLSTPVLAKDAVRGQVLMSGIRLRQEMASKVVSGWEWSEAP